MSKTQNLLDTAWQQLRQFQVQSSSKFTSIIADITDQWPLPMWNVAVSSSPAVLIMICFDVQVQIFMNKLRYVSTEVFAFSSVLASVSNSNIRSTIFIWRLGCLNIEK